MLSGSSRRRLLHNRDYVFLLSGQTVSSLGSAMSTFVFTLLAVAVTGSPTQAGLVGASFALGSTLASLPAGALVDRWNRKRVLVACASSGFLLYSSVVVALLLDHLVVWHLVVVAFGTGVSRAFFLPAQNAALRAIVQREDMGAAMSANEAREHFAGLVGAPVAGVMYSVARVIPIIFDAISYAVLTVAFLAIRAPLPAPHVEHKEPILKAIGVGVRWVLRHRAIRVIAFSATVINFAAQGIILVLVVHLQQIGTRSGVIGLLETGVGIGGLLGAIASAPLLAKWTTGRIAVTAVWVITACFAATAFTSLPLALVVLLGGAIFFVPSLNAGIFGYQVIITPDHMQGRAQSAIGFLATSTSALAPLVGGFLLEHAGIRVSVLTMAGLLALAALAVTASRPIREIPLLSDVTPEEAYADPPVPVEPAPSGPAVALPRAAVDEA